MRKTAAIVFSLAVVFVCVEAYFYFRETKIAQTQKSLENLAALTLKIFPTGQPSVGDVFWKAAGRKTPDRDPWGNEFDINLGNRPGIQEFAWRSAGPDGVQMNEDDLVVRSPFGKVLSIAEIGEDNK